MTQTEHPPTLPPLEDLITADPQALADQLQLPVAWVDHQATRRQKLHGVCIPGGEAPYSSTQYPDVLDHLDAEGYRDAVMLCMTNSHKYLACYIHFEMLT